MSIPYKLITIPYNLQASQLLTDTHLAENLSQSNTFPHWFSFVRDKKIDIQVQNSEY